MRWFASLVLTLALPCAAEEMGTELLLEAEINGRVHSRPAIVRDGAATGLLLRHSDLRGWGLSPPSTTPIVTIGSDTYVNVADVPGLRARVDFAQQRLIVAASPSLWPAIDIPLVQHAEAPTPSVPGAFVGYELFADARHDDSAMSGRLTAGWFKGAWNLANGLIASSVDGAGTTRLDTTLSRDWPNRLTGIRIGDTVTTPGSWGRAVRIGGVRWGTEFGTRPDLITFPLPAVEGEAVLPSTVDVFVNGALHARRDVPAGRFSLRDLPVVTGYGDVRLTVRDAFGREQSIAQPFFASEQLLRKGLSAQYVEVGFVREDYGLESFAYGRAAAVGGYRRGLSDRTTAEARAEILEEQQTLGASFATSTGMASIVSGSLAGSHTEEGAGWLARVGVSTTHRSFSADLGARAASEKFRQLGSFSGDGAFQSEIEARFGWLTGHGGSLGLVLVSRQHRDRDDARLLSATYGISVRGLGFVGAFATYDLNDTDSGELALTFTHHIGDRTSSRVATSYGREGASVGASVVRNMAASRGASYKLEVEQGAVQRFETGAAWQGDRGSLELDVRNVYGDTEYRGSAAGGLVLMPGGVAAVRTVDSSFAIVEVPAHRGIEIFHDNHAVATTNERGFAIVPGLRPYESNRLHISSDALPIEVAVDQREYAVRPYPHGAVRVRFAVSDLGGAVVHLLQANGAPVPAGATVRFGERSATVALDGAVYLSAISGSVDVEASWSNRRCSARFNVPMGVVQPDLGAVECIEAL
jgi:outer membrane usher protein